MIIISLTSHCYIIKNTNKSNNTQHAYIGLKPKSSHTIKYSQPASTFPRHIKQYLMP